MLDQIDQLLAQYLALKVKHQQVYFPNIFHRPFTKLGDDNIVRRRNEIKNIVKQGLFKEALRKCHGFIDDTMEGLLQEYFLIEGGNRHILLAAYGEALQDCRHEQLQ